jgi:DNA-binding IclR family transcriptional regulator
MGIDNRSRIFERGLEILGLIANKRAGVTVDELCEEIRLHRTSVYRYLGALVREGYVDRKNGKYVLGTKVLELASLFLERLDVRETAHPLLVELAEKLHATVHLAQLAGPEIIYIDKIETHRSLPLYSRIGKKAPAYCTALGKALLAFIPPERLQLILRQMTFKPYTDRTVTDPGRFFEELQEVKRTGYAVDKGEHEEGIFCVAAPIFDFYGEPVASVSVTDLMRNSLDKENRYVKEVTRTAWQISFALGSKRRTHLDGGR